MKPIPSPKSLPLIGTMLSIVASGGASKLHLYVDKRHKQLGPIYREKIGSVSGVFVADGNYMRKIFALEGKYPKHIVPESWILYNEMYNRKRGLFFMEGEEWLNFRKTMNNLMLKVEQDDFYSAASVAAQNLIKNLTKDNVVKDLEKQLYEWSVEVIVAVLLGSEKYKQCRPMLSRPIHRLSQEVHGIFIESAALSLLPVRTAAALKFPAWKRFVRAANSIVQLGEDLVETLLEVEKKKSGNSDERVGLLSEMMGTKMKMEDLKRIVIDLILAAGDTTAHTMQWLLHLLSMDSSVQTRIFNELNRCQRRDVSKCQLLKGALKETLRLYPVAPFITRFMPEDVILDDFEIRANELVLMSLYSSGRNEKYFPEANSFLPERWLRGDKGYAGVLNPNASLPFALGSRSCVGKKIAETQILVTLSKILQQYEITSVNNKKIEIVLHLISVPAEPIEIILKARK